VADLDTDGQIPNEFLATRITEGTFQIMLYANHKAYFLKGITNV